MSRLLSGIRVLDFSRVLAGPFCTAMMADLGAEIIKVEPPGGDDQRAMGAFRDGLSVSFELINRNKRSLKLDLKSGAGQDIAHRLAAECDVVVENFRPGVADRLGIGYPALRALRPDLIYCSISGFGQSGPLAEAPSYDVIAQALSGLMSVTGPEDGEPVLVGDSVGDTVSGLFAAWAISSALFRRQVTGEGARLDVAMFDSLFALLPTALARWQVSGQAPGRQGNQHPLSAPFGAYRAADGDFILAVANNPLFRRLAVAIGRPDLAEDARYSSDQSRFRNREALRGEIEAWTLARPAAAVVAHLAAAGIPASVVADVAEAATGAHARHRQLLTEVSHPVLGSVRLPEQPVHVDGMARGDLRPAPTLGEDGSDVLSELLGTTPDEIAALQAAGVI